MSLLVRLREPLARAFETEAAQVRDRQAAKLADEVQVRGHLRIAGKLLESPAPQRLHAALLGEPHMYPAPPFSLRGQASTLQLPEMRRHGRRRQLQDLDDLADAQLPSTEHGQHAQPRGVREGLVDPNKPGEGSDFHFVILRIIVI